MKFVKYLYYTLPFVVSLLSVQGVLNDNHYIKLFGFILIFLVMLILSLIYQGISSNTHVKLYLIDGCILGFLMLYLYFSWGNCNILDLHYPALYIFFYFFLRLSINKNDCWKSLTNISLVVISIHLIICCLQYINLFPNYNSYFDVGSTFGNPDALAAYLAVLFPMCYKGKNLRIVRYFVSFLTISLFFILQARTAIVATVIFIFLDVYLTKSFSKKWIWGGIPFFIMGFIFLVYWHIESFSGRILIWIVSISMIINKPLGWGVYAFEKHYPEFLSKFIDDYPRIGNLLNIDIVHSPYNEFLNIGVTLGVLGVILYGIFVGYIIKTAYKLKSPLLYPIIIFQIISLSYFPFRIFPLSIIYILLCALIVYKKQERGKFVVDKNKKKLICIILICYISIYTVCSLYSFIQWRHAVYYTGRIVDKTLFKKPFLFLKGNGRYLASYAEFCYKTDDNVKAFELMKQAENFYSDIPFLNNLAIIYEQNGFILEARKRYDLATKIAPANANIALAKIEFLDRIGERDEAYRIALLWKKKLASKKMKQRYKLSLIKINTLITNYEKEI